MSVNICTRSQHVSLDDILKETPKGLKAMFRVTSIAGGSMAEDWILGEMVYVSRNGNVCDFMSDENHGPVSDFGLHFIDYIKP